MAKHRLRTRHAKIGNVMTERELAYISRAIFRQRTDAPDDEPVLASKLDPLISLARDQHKLI